MANHNEASPANAAAYIMRGSFVFFFAGLFLLISGWSTYRPIDDGIVSSAAKSMLLPALLLSWLMVVLAAKLNEGEALSTRLKVGVFIFSLNGIGTLLFGGYIMGNGWLDSSPPQPAVVDITDKKMSRPTDRKSHPLYYLYFAKPSDNETKHRRVEVKQALFEQAKVGDSLHLEIHEGYFGFQWTGPMNLSRLPSR